MTTLARNTNSAVDSQLIKALHTAFEGLAKAVGTQVNAVIAQQLGRHAASKTIEKKVADAMPAFLEQAFIMDFLQDEKSARHRRVILAHLLSTAELQNIPSLRNLEVPVVALPAEPAAENTEELTSEAAAKLLHVSRSHLNTLVESGRLGEVRRTPGGHRRISMAAVLQYKASSKSRQAKGLDAMIEASERLGLYDQELAGAPRPKR
jgi:excisionase family DNA binding protein